MSGPNDQEVVARARQEVANMRDERLSSLLAQGPEGVTPELWDVLVTERKRRLALSNSVSDPGSDDGDGPFANVDWLVVGGAFLLLIGIGWLIHALTMDVSVSTGFLGPRVVNLGRMNDRQVQAIASGVLAMLGAVLLGFGLLRRR